MSRWRPAASGPRPAARALLREVLIAELRPELDRSIRALPHDDHPAVLLVVGVNGTGKTTTTGKLARVLVADGRRVVLGAADTFRAAAADQLQTWAERVGAEVVRGKEGGDPAAIAFDAVSRGIADGVDVVLIDTAGRLHTKTGLMDELGKVKRVIEKKASVDDVLLVLDATVGQNGLAQARVFAEVVDITGVVLTKLDGTAKGGIVFQVQHELGVPVKLVGLGEGADDLAPFEPGAFVGRPPGLTPPCAFLVARTTKKAHRVGRTPWRNLFATKLGNWFTSANATAPWTKHQPALFSLTTCCPARATRR